MTQSCMTCHNGGTYLSPAPMNIMAEVAKTGHPLPAGNNIHDAAEPVLLNHNRHATCVDCHERSRIESDIAIQRSPIVASVASGREWDQRGGWSGNP